MIHWNNACSSDIKLFNAITILFTHHPHLLTFLFHPSISKLNNPPHIVKKSIGHLSSGEKLLILIALDFWSSDGNASIGEINSILDDINLNAFLNALLFLRSESIAR